MGTPINSYSAGKTVYPGGGRSANQGAVTDKTGYNERDAKKKVRQEAQHRALADRYSRLHGKQGIR